MNSRLVFLVAVLASCTSNPSTDHLLLDSALRVSPVSQPVSPGLVPWHVDREAALAAAKESGRPILLFQMFGRLDERFC